MKSFVRLSADNIKAPAVLQLDPTPVFDLPERIERVLFDGICHAIELSEHGFTFNVTAECAPDLATFSVQEPRQRQRPRIKYTWGRCPSLDRDYYAPIEATSTNESPVDFAVEMLPSDQQNDKRRDTSDVSDDFTRRIGIAERTKTCRRSSRRSSHDSGVANLDFDEHDDDVFLDETPEVSDNNEEAVYVAFCKQYRRRNSEPSVTTNKAKLRRSNSTTSTKRRLQSDLATPNVSKRLCSAGQTSFKPRYYSESFANTKDRYNKPTQMKKRPGKMKYQQKCLENRRVEEFSLYHRFMWRMKRWNKQRKQNESRLPHSL